MIKNIFKKFIALGSPLIAVAPILAASAISVKTSNEKTSASKYKSFLYDNKIFNSTRQLLQYYLSLHKDAISSKSVIGNIDDAMVDYDDGILNQHKLHDYNSQNQHRIKPVYRKSNGELTSSFVDARASYANVVMIKKMFQGVSKLFADEKEAKAQRDKLVRPIRMTYYDDVPHPIIGEGPLKINPLNARDVSTYFNLFLKILNDQKDLLGVNKNYRRSFKIITEGIMDEALKSLFEGKDDLLYFINMFRKSMEDIVDGDQVFEYVEEVVDDDDDDQKIHSIKRKSVSNAVDAIESQKDENGNIDKDDSIDDTVDNIDVTFFNGKLDFKDYFKFYKETTAGPDDSFTGYTNVTIIGKDNIPDYNLKTEDIDALLENNNADFVNQLGKIIISDEKGHSWNVNANDSGYFKEFIKKGIDSIKKMREIFGSQFAVSINVDLVPNGKMFEGLHVKLNDDGETLYDNDNSFWVLGVDLSKFKFSWNFTFKKSMFPNLISNLIKQIETENSFWNQSLYSRIKYHINNFKDISNFRDANNLDGLSEHDIKSLIKLFEKQEITNVLNNITRVKEYINFYNASNFMTKEIIAVKRDSKNQDVSSLQSVFTPENLKTLVTNLIDPSSPNQDVLNKLINYLLGNKIDINDLLKIVQDISRHTFEYRDGLQDLSGDINHNIEQSKIILTFIQEIINHIKANKSELSKISYLQSNAFLKNIILNSSGIKFPPLLFNEDNNFKFPFKIKNGAYLLISDVLFNGSIVNKTGDGNINASGIFNTQKEVDENKKIILSSRPPVVRVMYNLNGEIILGNIDPEKPLLYDSQSMVKYEAEVIATPKKDLRYVFYLNDNNKEVILLNQISNVYVLKYENITRYFLNHKSLIKYLEHKLLESSDVQILTS